MKNVLSLILLLSIACAYCNMFTLQDSLWVESALAELSLSAQDLMFLKDWSDETYLKNDIIVKAINNPYYFIDYAKKWDMIKGSEGFHLLAYKFLNNNDIELTFPNKTDNRLRNTLTIEQLKDIVETYLTIKKVHFDHMFINLTSAELELMLAFTNNIFTQQDYDDELTPYTAIEIEEIAKKINWYLFYQPAIIEKKSYLSKKLVINSLKDFILNNMDHIIWTEESQQFSTPRGEIIIGSIYDDQHIINNAIAIIDPAGNDSYTFENNNQEMFFLFDANGNDYYRSESSLFSAKFGFSFAYDMSGDDIYMAKDEAFSAKLGFQEFIDYGGSDYYKAEMFSLGAALFGSSLLLDKSGNDTYITGEYGQGFASCWGISLLLDQGGSDSYICGTLEFHAPLVPDDYRSMGQGMGFGMRPDFAGGIGVLIDREGNDRYMGGVYAQGVGYWYGLGILIDNDGNDSYNAVYYPQGSGIHLAGGLLYDQRGEDSYYSKHGPGQGAGHDFGVGIFIDGSGNDHYSIEGGNGLGITNSVGIFIDKAGDDRYENAVNSNYGFGKIARSSGSIGLFLDGAGKDYYPFKTMQDSSSWKQGVYGIGVDSGIYATEPGKRSEVVQLSADIDSLAAIETIFGYASEWEVGNVINRVRRAREILLNRADESAEYIISNKMNTRDTKEYRAINEFFEQSVKSQYRLVDSLMEQDSLANKNAISLVSTLELTEYIPFILTFYDAGKYTSACISALANYKDDKHIPYLVKHINSPNEKLRFTVANALKNIDSKQARQKLKTMKKDKSFLVKTLAIEHLKNK